MPYLDNPFSRQTLESQYALPINTFGSKPNVVTAGDVQVITNKPIVTNNISDLPSGKIKRNKSQSEIDFDAQMKLKSSLEKMKKPEVVIEKDDNKKGMSKTTKIVLSIGAIILIAVVGYKMYKK